jgi:hypothetical protein
MKSIASLVNKLLENKLIKKNPTLTTKNCFLKKSFCIKKNQSWEPKDRFGSRFGSFENLGSGSGLGSKIWVRVWVPVPTFSRTGFSVRFWFLKYNANFTKKNLYLLCLYYSVVFEIAIKLFWL